MPRAIAAVAGLLLAAGRWAEAAAAEPAPSSLACAEEPGGDEWSPAGVELLQSKFSLETAPAAHAHGPEAQSSAQEEWLAELLQSVQQVSTRSPDQMRRAGVWDRCHEGVPLDACLTQAGTSAGHALAVGAAVLLAVLLVLCLPTPGPARRTKGGRRANPGSLVGRAAEGLLAYAGSGDDGAPRRPHHAAYSPAGDAEWLWAPDLSWNMQAF